MKRRKNSYRAHSSWTAMKTRCNNPNIEGYKNYGGRGIKVCERWETFENFLTDMGERPIGMSLDRINNDGNYEPGNCRWATRKQQSLNSRHIRWIEFQGVKLPENAMAARHGLTADQLARRLHDGWTIERALTQPMRKGCYSQGWDTRTRKAA
jgi:hypothetical protein